MIYTINTKVTFETKTQKKRIHINQYTYHNKHFSFLIKDDISLYKLTLLAWMLHILAFSSKTVEETYIEKNIDTCLLYFSLHFSAGI